jgi:hypothetical protein
MKRMSKFGKIVIPCLMGCMILVVSIILISHSGSQAVVLAEAAPPSPGLRLIKSDQESIVLELFTPAYEVDEKVVDNVTYHLLSVADYGEMSEVGRPQLPLKGVMLGIPAEAEVTLNVLESDVAVSAERYNPYPVPRPIVEQDLEGGVRYVGLEFAKDDIFYSTDDFYPADVAEVASTGFIRSQRFVQLCFYPFQYNPVTGELKHYRLIRVELSFRYTDRRPAATAGRVEEVETFKQVLKSTILNYDSAKKWRVRPRSTAPQVTALSQEPNYKILVDEDGIYQVTYDDLSAKGFPSGVVSSTLKLFNEGSEVAIHVHDPDGSFGSGDYFLFYGQKMNTKYTDVNVYWLTWNGENGRRMSVLDGTPSGTATVPGYFQTTQRVEEDHSYQSSHASGPDNDHWYWNYVLAAGSPASASYTTTLQHVATAPLSATVRGLFKGYGATPQHHTRVYLNGHLVDDAIWPPQAEYAFEAIVPYSYLIEATNTISVECPLDLGITMDIPLVNWFEIDYHDSYTAEKDSLFFAGDEAGTWEYQIDGFTTTHGIELFDITDPATPISITGEITPTYTLKFEDTITDRKEYLALTTAQRLSPVSIEQDVPSDLQSESNGADYIIITHSDFYTDVLPLADHRATQGLRTMVVDVEDVYDEFSYGIFDPTAIHDFLTYAYTNTNWQPPAPAYVLLVGDGNFDFKNNRGWGEPNYVPPYLADVDPYIGETATDNQYVCVSGGDLLPDMDIGRLPVQTSAQASTMVNKILNYEQNPPSDDWNKSVLFVADNQPDPAGNFWDLSDDIANNYLPNTYTAQKIYYTPGNPPYSTPDSVRTAITNTINEGRLLVNYVGHSGVQYWASEKLFRIDDIAVLTNTESLPLMMPMTCQDGYFIWPKPPGDDYSSLGESIVRASGGGAIASWSPTGMGTAIGHHYMNKGFFTAVFSDTISEIGQATYLGKLNLYNKTGGEGSAYRDLMDTYLLFGDPFTKLNLPACDAADFDKDRQITVVDITQVAIRWDTKWGDTDFDRKYDLDNDGDITVIDIMKVAAQWGNNCGTP